MIYRQWDIVLLPFPFTNLKAKKKRPALVLSNSVYNRGEDVMVMFITSNIAQELKEGDYLLEDWKKIGLPKPSMTRMKIATIQRKLVLKRLTTISGQDQMNIKEIMADFFDLKT